MKLTRVALAVLLATPAFAIAEITVTPSISYQTFDNILKDDYQPQIALGFRAGSVGLEAVYSQGTSGLVDSRGNRFTNQDGVKNDGTADYEQYRLDGLYFLSNGASRLEPYLAAGVGKIKLEGGSAGSIEGNLDKEGSYWQGNVGGGLQYAINDFLKLRLDSRYLHWVMGDGKGGDNNVDDVQTSLGLQLALGGAKAVAPIVVEEPKVVVEDPKVITPADDDQDGVINADDQCPNTARNVVVDATGCAKMIEKSAKMELRVFFDTNKSFVKPVFKPEIAKAADMLKAYPEVVAQVEGHTDNRGSRKLNDRLSLARANAVKNILVSEHGIASNRLTAEGFAFTRPVASNDTPEGRAMNRRVYVAIVGNRKVEIVK